MKVGWVGLGKLGLPCAVALDAAGHDVCGTDVNPAVAGHLEQRTVPYREEQLDKLLAEHTVTWRPTIAEVVADADIVFVAVQTPHQPAYDGTRPAPADTRDFEYGYLAQAVREVAAAAWHRPTPVTVVVVSTCLPGTFNRHLRHLAGPMVRLVYNPFFIAMGTTIADFTSPEFVLVGCDQGADAEQLVDLYSTVHDRPIVTMSIESAELTKVAYNVYLSSKIAFANFVGEVCHKTGADCDDVTGALALATDRVVSPRYMTAGMGDGGGCHPRDLIALSHLAERLDLSHDLAGVLMEAREAHSRWLASIVGDWARLTRLPIVVLGKAYKPETNLTAGSPAALLAHDIEDADVDVVEWFDPHIDRAQLEPEPAVYVIATRHDVFAAQSYPTGSVVIDPFGYVPDQPGVTVVRIGRKR